MILKMEATEKILYLNPLKLDGPEQMAIDLLLLKKSFTHEDFNMAIRFYTWNGDWISIGKNQKQIPKKWIKLAKERKIKLVRRPSGGQSVLHSNGLTYSLIWKNPPRNKKKSYLKTTKWLMEGMKKAGVDLSLGNEPVNMSNNNCFSSSTTADLIDKNKNKYIGSAQFWMKGHLLQHGEILIDPSKKLWKEVFKSNPPKIKNYVKEEENIINYLKKSICYSWPHLTLSNYELDKQDKKAIKLLAKYYFDEFTLN